MSVLNQNTLIGASGTAGGGGGGGGGAYTIDNSLRFNDDDSAYLSRTPSVAGNRKTWTWSGWVKRGNLSNGLMFAATTELGGGNSNCDIRFNNDTIYINDYVAGVGSTWTLATTQLFRDSSSYYHVILSVDTTQATANDRIKLYVNGVQVTSFSTANYPALNSDGIINSTAYKHKLGNAFTASSVYGFDGYLAEVNFIDGLALTPASFGEFGDYGEWKPLKYTGSYGTNGFYLDFANSGDLGNDVSGNANDWTPTNLAATDQMLDSPTNNFATFTPLRDRTTSNIATLSEGNLKSTGTSTRSFSSMALTTGKYYCEFHATAGSSTCQLGIRQIDDYSSNSSNSTFYLNSGASFINLSSAAYGTSYSASNVIGMAYDADTNQVTFYRDNVSQGTLAFSGTEAVVEVSHGSYWTVVANFGQDSSFAGNKTAQGNSDSNGIGDFYYTPPAGFLALCTQNLPEPTVIPSEHFNTVLYTGNGGTQSVTGVGFGSAPDFTWIKERSSTSAHSLFDVVRGATKYLASSSTSAEGTSANQLTSFDSDGFTTGSSGGTNQSGQTYAAWNWKANGTGVSNTDGTITSTVSANVDAGFSIISYTGNGTDATDSVGHGLSIPPEIVITKNRGNTDFWVTLIPLLGTGKLALDDTPAYSGSGWFTTIDSTTINGLYASTSYSSLNANNEDYIAYAFHSVDGYSKVGSYTGNGSADGTFVHCGFRPAYVMVKRTDSANDWVVTDNARDPYNVTDKFMKANSSVAEISFTLFDITANGIKLRTSSTGWNADGGTYIYLAFAESPFKYSNAR
jgi:hypothetical protein